MGRECVIYEKNLFVGRMKALCWIQLQQNTAPALRLHALFYCLSRSASTRRVCLSILPSVINVLWNKYGLCICKLELLFKVDLESKLEIHFCLNIEVNKMFPKCCFCVYLHELDYYGSDFSSILAFTLMHFIQRDFHCIKVMSSCFHRESNHFRFMNQMNLLKDSFSSLFLKCASA